MRELTEVLKAANVAAYEAPSGLRLRFNAPAPIVKPPTAQDEEDELYGASPVKPMQLGRNRLQVLDRSEISSE